VSGLGLPAVLKLTAGQQADVSSAKDLLGGVPAGAEVKAVIADKAYDSMGVVGTVEAMPAEAVIPTLRTRKEQRQIDKDLYKERNLAERFWRKAKEFRRVATRYEKTARNFLAFVHVASIMILLQ
jgi:transposase